MVTDVETVVRGEEGVEGIEGEFQVFGLFLADDHAGSFCLCGQGEGRGGGQDGSAGECGHVLLEHNGRVKGAGHGTALRRGRIVKVR